MNREEYLHIQESSDYTEFDPHTEVHGFNTDVTPNLGNEEQRNPEYNVPAHNPMTQLEVITAIKEYADGALNGDAGALWDAMPSTWEGIVEDLLLWVTHWSPHPTQVEEWNASMRSWEENK